MRAVKNNLPTPSGKAGELEDPRWIRAVGDHLVSPQEQDEGAWSFDARSKEQSRPLPLVVLKSDDWRARQWPVPRAITVIV